MYTCGPTVYSFAHIGNFLTFTFVDILRKCLPANVFQLDHVMNITDVDDKIIRNAGAEHKDPPSTPRPSWKIAPPSDWSGPSASSPPPTISPTWPTPSPA